MAILFVKKDYAIAPMIVAMCFFPADIPIMISAFHLYPIRILSFFGLLKIIFNPAFTKVPFNLIDKIFISYNLLGTIIYVIASNDKIGAFVFKAGFFIDSVICYIVLRYFIQSKNNITLSIKLFCICTIVLLPFALSEFYLANNLFSILGRSAIGVRTGEVRAAAAFNHAILFGSFAAALFPIMWAGYKAQNKAIYLLSALCCLFFVYASASSGPIVALAGAIFFLSFFKWRQYGSILAWFTLLTTVFIHFARETPIWHFLYVRIAIKASSTGYHRYLLTDAAVKEFWDWWLLGYGAVGPQWHLKYWPRNWATFTDVTNHYLLEGVRGGFFTMLLFILLCYKVIKASGSLSLSLDSTGDQWMWWGFAVMMITHCLSFLSVAYFGQITMLLYFTFAVAAFAFDESEKMQKIVR